MQPSFSWPTIITLLVSSALSPWLTSVGLDLTGTQQSWISNLIMTGMVAGSTWFAHHVHTGGPSSKPPGVVLKMFVPFALIMTLFVITAGLSACSTLLSKDPAVSTLEQVAVEYAVGKVVEAGQSPADRIARAQQVKTIATAIEAIAAGDKTTIAQLEQLAAAKIATLNLQPSDLLLANALMTAVVNELAGKVSTGVLSSSEILILDQVLGWVVQGAQLYGA